MQDTHEFYKKWLEKSKLGQLLPRTVFLFGFNKEENMRENFLNGNYDSIELTLLYRKDTDRDYPYWQEYLDELKNDIGYIIPYVDDKGNIYKLLVDALCRKDRMRNGKLPIALVTDEKAYYAGDDPMLVLPDCFV